MLVSTDAIILSKLKYGDSNIILSSYTKEFGLKSYLLKGVLKQRKGKIKPAYLQPLLQVHIEGNHKDNRSLQSISELKPLFHYKTLHTNISKGAIVILLR